MTTTTFPYTLVDGDLIPFKQAILPLAHPVFLTGFGVYESIQVDRGRPFHLQDHIERLKSSADMLSISLPPVAEMVDWGRMLPAALPPQTYSLQILAFGEAASAARVAFIPKPIRTYPPEYRTQGARAITFEGQRALPQCKSMNTLVNHLARLAAQEAGAVEAILTHHNELSEGARSNVFAVEAATQRLLTPPASKTLSGITKDVVIQIMQNTPYPVLEADIFADAPFSEMFITSTSMHVMPVTALNGRPVGDGRVGPVTRLASAKFEEYYAKHLAEI